MKMTTRDVARPHRKDEYRLSFASRDAEKGWTDLVATSRNAAADAWEFLAKTPTAEDGTRCYRLNGRLSTVTINDIDYQRWQYKPTRAGRIWYIVTAPTNRSEAGTVLLERVTTGHPNETVKQHR